MVCKLSISLKNNVTISKLCCPDIFYFREEGTWFVKEGQQLEDGSVVEQGTYCLQNK